MVITHIIPSLFIKLFNDYFVVGLLDYLNPITYNYKKSNSKPYALQFITNFYFFIGGIL